VKKYKNVSGKDIGFIIDGKTYDFQNGQIVAVSEGVKERVDYLISKIVPVEEVVVPVVPIIIKPKIEPFNIEPKIETVVAKPKKKSVKKK
jgi:hypothetical protein